MNYTFIDKILLFFARLVGKKYCTRKIFRMSDFGEDKLGMSSQGFDVFNDTYLYQGSHGVNAPIDNLVIYDLKNKNLKAYVLPKSSHLNTISVKHNLIAISRCDWQEGSECDCYFIEPKTDKLKIKFSIYYQGKKYGKYNYNWIITDDYLYTYGYCNSKHLLLLKFDLPEITSSYDVRLSDKNIIQEYIIDYPDNIFQGVKIYNNILYAVFGYGTNLYPGYFITVDLNDKTLTPNEFKLSNKLGELEDIALYKGCLIINNNSTNPIYRKFIF